MTIAYLWKAVKQRSWLVLLSVLVAAAIGLWYTLAQAPTYSTEATISITSTDASSSPKASVELADALAPTLVTYMGTETFASQVLTRTELSMTPLTLLSNVTAWHVPGTPLLKIRASSQYQQQAYLMANGVAQTMVDITNEQARQKLTAPAVESETAKLRQETEEELLFYRDFSAEVKLRLAEYRSQPASQMRDEGIGRLTEQLVAVDQTMNDLRQSLPTFRDPAQQTQPAYVMSILDPAPQPLVPQTRPFARNLGLALGIGLLCGVILAFIPESLDYTVATPEELEEALGITALGAIARIGGKETEDDPIERLVTRNYPRSPSAEAFRTLRTNIRFARPDRPRGSLMITSTQPGEGKTLVSANLSVAIAQEGRTAIIIDGDLRRPSLHRFFGLPNRLGFTSLIMDESLTLDDVLQETDVPGLSVITSGPLPPNPLDMLASKRAEQLLMQVKERCDTMIIDSPPVLSVTDCMLLATHVDAALLVASARSTRRDLIIKAFNTLCRSGVDVIGSVLNKVRQSDLGYYYSHYYYGYYYGTPESVPEELPLVGRMQEPGNRSAVSKP